MQVVGPCKTEASQKPIPLDAQLAEALQAWRQVMRYKAPDDWVFASPKTGGRRPYWGQRIFRTFIRPAAAKIGITQKIGWHTFRQTYSSLLRATRADIKVMQELLRHASSRVPPEFGLSLCLFVPVRKLAIPSKSMKGFGVPDGI